MSSGGVTVADGGPQMYFCHQCNHTVTISPSPVGDLLCPTCNSGFVEEFVEENPNPRNSEAFIPDPFSFLLSQFLPPAADFARHSHEPPADPDVYDPMTFLLGLLANRRGRGISYEFVVDGGNSGSGFSLPANMGDYFIGPGFEELIQQLAENDPNRYGTPPAAKSAVQGLPSIKVDEDLLKSELAQCAVCKDDFEMATTIKQLPCKHVYHEECILPWLEMHNSCPVCRFELPTDDPEYENKDNVGRSGVAQGDGGDSDNSNDSAQGSEGTRVVERRFTITLPGGFSWGSGSGTGPSGGGANQQRRGSN